MAEQCRSHAHSCRRVHRILFANVLFYFVGIQLICQTRYRDATKPEVNQKSKSVAIKETPMEVDGTFYLCFCYMFDLRSYSIFLLYIVESEVKTEKAVAGRKEERVKEVEGMSEVGESDDDAANKAKHPRRAQITAAERERRRLMIDAKSPVADDSKRRKDGESGEQVTEGRSRRSIRPTRVAAEEPRISTRTRASTSEDRTTARAGADSKEKDK